MILDNLTPEDLIGVSDSTLRRRRNKPKPNNLPYHRHESGVIYYYFSEVLEALKMSKFGGSKIKCGEAIAKMRAFQLGRTYNPEIDYEQE